MDPSVLALAALIGVVLLIIAASQAVAARRRTRELERAFEGRIQSWIEGEKARIVAEQSAIAAREALVRLEEWKRQAEDAIRQDAIKRSQSVIVGKVTEHLVPYLPAFSWNPKDARFIGAPIDFLVFDGLDEGKLRNIIFVEVKTGSSVLTDREKQIRAAIAQKRVGWAEIRPDRSAPPASASLPAPRTFPHAASFVRRFFR